MSCLSMVPLNSPSILLGTNNEKFVIYHVLPKRMHTVWSMARIIFQYSNTEIAVSTAAWGISQSSFL
jgi:hypothetical protein